MQKKPAYNFFSYVNMDYFIIKNIFYFIFSVNLSITISYMILSAMQTYHMNKNNKVDTYQNNN